MRSSTRMSIVKHTHLAAGRPICVGSSDSASITSQMTRICNDSRSVRCLIISSTCATIRSSPLLRSIRPLCHIKSRIWLWWRDFRDGKRKLMMLEVIDFVGLWLLHVLPEGLTQVRHYGFLGSAAVKSYRRLRFLL